MHVSVNKTIMGSDNGLSPVRRQAIIWTHDQKFAVSMGN